MTATAEREIETTLQPLLCELLLLAHEIAGEREEHLEGKKA